MRRPWLLAIPVVLAGGIAAWWLLRGDADGAAGASEALPSTPVRADATSTVSNEAVAVTPAAGASRAHTPDDPSARATGQRGAGQAVSASPTTRARSVPPADAGPRPLSQEGQTRIDAMRERLLRTDRNIEDYEALVGLEPRDPDWSGRMEATLQLAILRHGGALTGLEVSAPRCTQTLCKLTATSSAAATERADADWLGLAHAIANEPWWRQEFFNVATSVAIDDTGLVYFTYFIRK